MNLEIIDRDGRHLAKDPLTGRWVIYSPRELKALLEKSRRSFAPEDNPPQRADWCYFCPGNNLTNPDICRVPTSEGLIRVTTKHDLDLVVTIKPISEGHGIYDLKSPYGADETVVIGENHGLRLSQLPIRLFAASLSLCRERLQNLIHDPNLTSFLVWTDGNNRVDDFGYVHPQWHISSINIVYPRIQEEIDGSYDHFYTQGKERCLVCDQLRQETTDHTGIIEQTSNFLAYVPYSARHPLEIWIAPKKHSALFEADGAAYSMLELATLIQNLIRKAELLMGARLPYSLALFNAPRRFVHKASHNNKPLSQEEIGRLYHWRFRFKPYLVPPSKREDVTGISVNPLLSELAAEALRLPESEIASRIA